MASHGANDEFRTADTAGHQFPPENIFGDTKKLKFILQAIAEYRAGKPGDISVLDFGCGNAAGVGRFLIGEGTDYVGVDFHEPSLSFARTHFGTPRARFLDAVPADATFDVIVFADVLEHVTDPLGLLTAYLPQLKPGGIVIGSVPNGYGPCEVEKYIDTKLRLYAALRWLKRTALRLAGRPKPDAEAVPYNSGNKHVVFFTRRSLDAMIAAAGLKTTKFRHAGFVGADLTGSTIFAHPGFVAWNVKVSDRLPSWAVSAWHFVMTRSEAPRG